MKCLPQNKISQAQGVVLHDWHAEVLVIRSFNRFLLDECHALAMSQKQSSEYVRLRSREERTESHYQPFALNDDINLHMYCSEAPCKSLSTPLHYSKSAANIFQVAMPAWSSPWLLKKTPHPGTSPLLLLPTPQIHKTQSQLYHLPPINLFSTVEAISQP
jgi:hypothetical protein